MSPDHPTKTDAYKAWKGLPARRATADAFMHAAVRAPIRRATVDALQLAAIRPLTIQDMPVELLSEIFGYLSSPLCHRQPGDLDFLQRGSSEIANVRLACQRFADASSHLLIPYAEVRVDRDSVEALEELSQHPTIGKGVRAVRVRLHLYDGALATDIAHFARKNERALVDRIQRLKITLRQSALADDARAAHEVELQDKSAALDAWRSLAAGTPDDAVSSDQERQHRALLRLLHQGYRRRYEDQQRLLKDNTFARAVAGAMAYMPMARSLIMDTMPDSESQEQQELRTVKCPPSVSPFFWRMTYPAGWLSPLYWKDYTVSPAAVDILHGLPVALHKYGAPVKGIKISGVRPQAYAPAELTQHALLELTAACRKLRNFSFDLYLADPLARCEGSSQKIATLLAAFLETSSLRHLSLTFPTFMRLPGQGQDQDLSHLSLGSALASTRRRKLTSCFLWYMPLHLSELQHFLQHNRIAAPLDRDSGSSSSGGIGSEQKTSGPGRPVEIRHMHLLDGTWEEALEEFRESRAERDGRPICWRISRVTGGELSNISASVYDDVFGGNGRTVKSKGLNAAECYVRGLTDRNPLSAGAEMERGEESQQQQQQQHTQDGDTSE